jgi:hypothetical protein
MINFSSIFTNLNGGPWPDWVGKNASGAGTTDGTEFIAALLDNLLFGPIQNIMSIASVSPNGVTESASACQIMDALYLILGPPGTICEWNLVNDPSSYGARFLLLNGQGILRADYIALDTNVYVGDANNATADAYFHADDAAGTSRNTAGVYLILPESRGYVPRGLDTAATIDPDGASRTLGHLQLDTFQGHTLGYGGSDVKTANVLSAGASEVVRFTTGTSLVIMSDGLHGAPRTSTETRMTNRATKFAIRY